MEGETPPAPNIKSAETPSPTKPVSKSRYTSCLSSFRNNYKPPANFNPANVSSPIIVAEKKPLESVANPSFNPSSINGVIPSPCSAANPSSNSFPVTPSVLPQISSFIDVPVPSPVQDETGMGSPSFGNYVSLTGKGGNWRGPHQADMTPENQGRQKFRQGSGFKNSRGGRDSYMGGLNSSTPNQSFGKHNLDGNNSFNSSQGRFSPYNSPGNNSSNNRGNSRGSFHKTPSVDISSYYSPAMTQDPWADLKRRKLLRENTNSSPKNSPRY